LDGSSVQSLLESQTLISEVEQSGICHELCRILLINFILCFIFVFTAINQDEEDIFQCGKCKSQFTSLHLFVLHKREHTKVPEEKVDLSQYLVSNDSHILQTDDNCQDGTQYNPEDDFDQAHQLGESIILEENDILFR
jgi:hypothetical protein